MTDTKSLDREKPYIIFHYKIIRYSRASHEVVTNIYLKAEA